MSIDYIYSVLRVVPDPVKNEAVNIGAVVVEADGPRGDIIFTERFKTRVAALRKDFPVAAIVAAVEDLKVFLGLEPKVRFGAETVVGNPRARLDTALRYLEGQLQLTEPRSYQAESLDSAVQEIYQRYVAKKLPRPVEIVTNQPTASQMRNRIWATVRKWQRPNLDVERGTIIHGREARHAADFVLRNGRPQTAIFALPVTEAERAISFLYRDSLPTIAEDMQAEDPNFQVVGVLPDTDLDASAEVHTFIRETEALFSDHSLVTTVQLSELPDIEKQLTRRLL